MCTPKVHSALTSFDAILSAAISLNSPTTEEKLNNLININEISQRLDENLKVCNAILAKFKDNSHSREASPTLISTDQLSKHLSVLMTPFLIEEK